MKKVVLFATIMLGAVAASQAGVHVGFGFSVPLVAPAPVMVSPPAVAYAPPAPVYQYPPRVVYRAPVVCAPRVYAPAPSFYFGFGSGWRHGWGHYGWGHHYRWGHCGGRW